MKVGEMGFGLQRDIVPYDTLIGNRRLVIGFSELAIHSPFENQLQDRLREIDVQA